MSEEKNLKEATAFLNNLDTARINERREIGKKLEEARQELQEAAEVLEITNDEDEYIKAAETVAKAKARINIYRRQLETITESNKEEAAKHHDILLDDYKEMCKAASAELESKLAEFIAVYDAYLSKARSYKGLINGCNHIRPGKLEDAFLFPKYDIVHNITSSRLKRYIEAIEDVKNAEDKHDILWNN